REGEVFGPLPRIEVDPFEDRLGGVDDDDLTRRGELTDMRKSDVRPPLRFRVRFGSRSDRYAFRNSRGRSDAAVGQYGGAGRLLVCSGHIPFAVSMCTGLLVRRAGNRLPGHAEADQMGLAERPRSSIAETTAERTGLRPTNGGAPRPRCTRSGLGAPPCFRWESPPGARRVLDQAGAQTRPRSSATRMARAREPTTSLVKTLTRRLFTVASVTNSSWAI